MANIYSEESGMFAEVDDLLGETCTFRNASLTAVFTQIAGATKMQEAGFEDMPTLQMAVRKILLSSPPIHEEQVIYNGITYRIKSTNTDPVHYVCSLIVS